MTHVESVTAALADEPKPREVTVHVCQTNGGDTQVRLHTAAPYHQSAFIVAPGEKNVEQLYLHALNQHQRAVRNLGGGGR